MTANPHHEADKKSKRAAASMSFTKGRVIDVPNSDEAPHVVIVKPRGKDNAIPAPVLVTAEGDSHVPKENSQVLLANVEGDMYAVVGQYYTTDEETPNPSSNSSDERYISHQISNAHIHFDADGNLTVQNANGTSITLDGDSIILGDGGTSVITDIETTTDGDGHVTDVTPVRSNVIQIE